MRRFEQHGAARLGLQAQHGGLALGRLGGQKAAEHKACLAAAAGHGTRHAERSGDAAGTGQRQHAQTGGAHHGGQAGARVAHARGAGVTHIGHALALLQPGQHGLGRLGLVVLVHGQQLCAGLVDAVGAQQALGVARVFAGQGVGQLQHMQRAQRDVGQIADGRGHHVQGALRIMLGSRRVVRGAQG